MHPISQERISLSRKYPNAQRCAIAIGTIAILGACFFLALHVAHAPAKKLLSLKSISVSPKGPFYPTIGVIALSLGALCFLELQYKKWVEKQLITLTEAIQSLFPKDDNGHLSTSEVNISTYNDKINRLIQQDPHPNHGHPLYFFSRALRSYMPEQPNNSDVNTVLKRFAALQKHSNDNNSNENDRVSPASILWAPIVPICGKKLLDCIYENACTLIAQTQEPLNDPLATLDAALRNVGAYLCYNPFILLTYQAKRFAAVPFAMPSPSIPKQFPTGQLTNLLDVVNQLSDQEAFGLVEHMQVVAKKTIPIENLNIPSALLQKGFQGYKSQQQREMDAWKTIQNVQDHYTAFHESVWERYRKIVDNESPSTSQQVSTWLQTHSTDMDLAHSLLYEDPAQPRAIRVIPSPLLKEQDIQASLENAYHSAFMMRCKEYAKEGWSLDCNINSRYTDLLIQAQDTNFPLYQEFITAIANGKTAVFLGYKDWIDFLRLETGPTANASSIDADLLERLVSYFNDRGETHTTGLTTISEHEVDRWKSLVDHFLYIKSYFIDILSSLPPDDINSLYQCGFALDDQYHKFVEKPNNCGHLVQSLHQAVSALSRLAILENENLN